MHGLVEGHAHGGHALREEGFTRARQARVAPIVVADTHDAPAGRFEYGAPPRRLPGGHTPTGHELVTLRQVGVEVGLAVVLDGDAPRRLGQVERERYHLVTTIAAATIDECRVELELMRPAELLQRLRHLALRLRDAPAVPISQHRPPGARRHGHLPRRLGRKHPHAHQHHAELAVPLGAWALRRGGGAAARRCRPQPHKQPRVTARVVRGERLRQRGELVGTRAVAAVDVASHRRRNRIKEHMQSCSGAICRLARLRQAASEVGQLAQLHAADERRNHVAQRRWDADRSRREIEHELGEVRGVRQELRRQWAGGAFRQRHCSLVKCPLAAGDDGVKRRARVGYPAPCETAPFAQVAVHARKRRERTRQQARLRLADAVAAQQRRRAVGAKLGDHRRWELMAIGDGQRAQPGQQMRHLLRQPLLRVVPGAALLALDETLRRQPARGPSSPLQLGCKRLEPREGALHICLNVAVVHQHEVPCSLLDVFHPQLGQVAHQLVDNLGKARARGDLRMVPPWAPCQALQYVYEVGRPQHRRIWLRRGRLSAAARGRGTLCEGARTTEACPHPEQARPLGTGQLLRLWIKRVGGLAPLVVCRAAVGVLRVVVRGRGCEPYVPVPPVRPPGLPAEQVVPFQDELAAQERENRQETQRLVVAGVVGHGDEALDREGRAEATRERGQQLGHGAASLVRGPRPKHLQDRCLEAVERGASAAGRAAGVELLYHARAPREALHRKSARGSVGEATPRGGAEGGVQAGAGAKLDGPAAVDWKKSDEVVHGAARPPVGCAEVQSDPEPTVTLQVVVS